MSYKSNVRKRNNLFIQKHLKIELSNKNLITKISITKDIKRHIKAATLKLKIQGLKEK